MKTKLTTIGNQRAWQLLDDPKFLGDWTVLHGSCPWATPFQSQEYVTTWFLSYRTQFDPIVVMQYNEHDELTGLLILANETGTKNLVVAGGHQAEYQAWLEKVSNTGFLDPALEALSDAGYRSDLNFRYVVDSSAIASLKNATSLVSRISITALQRPLWKLSEADVTQSLRKKGNKSRLNRLKRLGELEFSRIGSPEDFNSALDAVIPYYDFRQGALNDSYPFLHDDLKQQFHVNLLSEQPELLHITVMTIDGVPISMHIGICAGETVHLAILLHSPMLAKFSPGKLHMLKLGELLVQEGKHLLDLTPGGDPWKERFATHHDEVFEVLIHRHGSLKLWRAALARVRKTAKTLMLTARISPDTARRAFGKLVRIRPNSLLNQAQSLLWEQREYRVYRYPSLAAAADLPTSNIRRDCISDLLLFEETESWQTRRNFMSDALRRLESGEHVYTYSENGKLLHYGWFIESQTNAYFSEIEQQYGYPEKGSVLYDFYSHPAARGRGLYQKSIVAMLQEAAAIGSQAAYISCLADNAPSRHVIEKIGFSHESSLFLVRKFGRTKKWQTPSAIEAA